jgi:hypothetical protein
MMLLLQPSMLVSYRTKWSVNRSDVYFNTKANSQYRSSSPARQAASVGPSPRPLLPLARLSLLSLVVKKTFLH